MKVGQISLLIWKKEKHYHPVDSQTLFTLPSLHHSKTNTMCLWVSCQSKMKLQSNESFPWKEERATELCMSCDLNKQMISVAINKKKKVMLVEKTGKLLPLTNQVCTLSYLLWWGRLLDLRGKSQKWLQISEGKNEAGKNTEKQNKSVEAQLAKSGFLPSL
jgi:hypothetical protein